MAPRFEGNRHMKAVGSALRTGRFYAPGNIPGTPFLLEALSTPGLMTPSGIEPATFRLVAQRLNQLHHRVGPTL